MGTFAKYKQNLKIQSWKGNGYIYSYDTRVARLDHIKKEVIQLGWWSVTTQKHINYTAKELGYNLNKKRVF